MERTSRADAEVRRFALVYLSSNIGDLLGDWPDFFEDSNSFSELRAMSIEQVEEYVNLMVKEIMG